MEDSIEGLLAKYSLGDLIAKVPKTKGIDFTTGEEVELTDPSMYTTVRVEPADIPEGAKTEERGSGINKRQVLVGADVKDNDPFGRFLGGFADLILQDITDFDKRGNIRGEEHTKGLRPGSGYGKEWNQEKENKLVEEKRRADIASGRSVPSLEEAAESEQYRDFVFNKERERYNQVIQDQLAYAIENNPKLARAMLPVLAEARRTSEGMPSSIQARMYASALTARENASRQAQLLNAATTAAQSGLGRYSGIRVT
tara:strand:+ start:12 stop:779 length:768 start_codon:yes stop_codon:yes gene_type:complete